MLKNKATETCSLIKKVDFITDSHTTATITVTANSNRDAPDTFERITSLLTLGIFGNTENTSASVTGSDDQSGVNSVQYGEGLVEKLVGVFDAIEKITVVAALALIIVTIFLIINTIKLTIFSRKREIGIMRLVGASNSRIKLPFVIEGIILGMIGSIIPILVVVFGYTTMYDYFGGVLFSPVIKLVSPMPFVVNASLIILIIGMFVGMFGSARAVRRYIKV